MLTGMTGHPLPCMLLACAALAGCAAAPVPPPDLAPAPPGRFEARGQEPGWAAELDPSQGLTLTLDYGERRLAAPPPRVDLAPGRTVYSTRSGSIPVRMVVEHRPCADAMSGRPYPATVTLTVADRSYRGCGGPAPEPAAIAGRHWLLETLDGAPPPPGVRPSLDIAADGRVSGSGGCNTFSAEPSWRAVDGAPVLSRPRAGRAPRPRARSRRGT
jgi:uncharacterized membrane protein